MAEWELDGWHAGGGGVQGGSYSGGGSWPREVFALLLAPLSAPYGGGGMVAGWSAGKLVGRLFISTLHTGGGVGVGVVVVGAQLEKTSAPYGGLQYTEGGCTILGHRSCYFHS
jgi:hypothetical protein